MFTKNAHHLHCRVIQPSFLSSLMIKNFLRQFGGPPFFINGHCSLINRANRPATVSPQTSPQEEKAQARSEFSVRKIISCSWYEKQISGRYNKLTVMWGNLDGFPLKLCLSLKSSAPPTSPDSTKLCRRHRRVRLTR